MTLGPTIAGLLVLTVGIVIGVVLGALGSSASIKDLELRHARLRTVLARIAVGADDAASTAATNVLLVDRKETSDALD